MICYDLNDLVKFYVMTGTVESSENYVNVVEISNDGIDAKFSIDKSWYRQSYEETYNIVELQLFYINTLITGLSK